MTHCGPVPGKATHIQPPTNNQYATSLPLGVPPVDTLLTGTQAVHLVGIRVIVHASTDCEHHTCCLLRGRKARQIGWYARRKVKACRQEKRPGSDFCQPVPSATHCRRNGRDRRRDLPENRLKHCDGSRAISSPSTIPQLQLTL